MYTYCRYCVYSSSLRHYYIIIILSSLHTGVNDDMTAVVAELNQLLEEAEQVSSERQEARANNQPVAMDTEAAEPATVVRGHITLAMLIICLYRVGSTSGHRHIVTRHPQVVGAGRVCHCLAWELPLETE